MIKTASDGACRVPDILQEIFSIIFTWQLARIIKCDVSFYGSETNDFVIDFAIQYTV